MIIKYGFVDEIVIRLTLAVIIGGIVGFERENKNRPAGFRTHILVCVGATCAMLLSDIMFQVYRLEYGINIDPNRLGAQVISGVGFLGAGTIIHASANVRGLTTAASLWTVAIIGLVVGSGLYFMAFFATTITIGTLIFFNKYSHQINERSRNLDMLITVVHDPKSLGRITMFFGNKNIQLLEVNFVDMDDIAKISEGKTCVIKVVAYIDKNVNYSTILSELSTLKGVINVERV